MLWIVSWARVESTGFRVGFVVVCWFCDLVCGFGFSSCYDLLGCD